MSFYYVSVSLHIFAALFWLGGMFFLAAVGAPVLRKVEPPELRASLFRSLGKAFRTSGWIAIGVLVITGFANLHFKGLLALDVIGSPAFWATPIGTALAWKLGAVAGMVSISGVHDFALGPRASRLPPGTPAGTRARRQAALLARLNAILGIVVVLAAIRLAR